MPAPRYPHDTLPGVSRWTFTPGQNALQSDEVYAYTERRRSALQEIRTGEAAWTYLEGENALFQSWYDTELNKGIKRFYVQLPAEGESGFLWHVARILKKRVATKGFGYHEVVATLEVYPIIGEPPADAVPPPYGALPIYLPFDGADGSQLLTNAGTLGGTFDTASTHLTQRSSDALFGAGGLRRNLYSGSGYNNVDWIFPTFPHTLYSEFTPFTVGVRAKAVNDFGSGGSEYVDNQQLLVSFNLIRSTDSAVRRKQVQFFFTQGKTAGVVTERIEITATGMLPMFFNLSTTYKSFEVGFDGTDYYVFVDGVLVNVHTTQSTSSTFFTGALVRLDSHAAAFPPSRPGLYLAQEELFLKVGQCMHTASFTPPTVPLG